MTTPSITPAQIKAFVVALLALLAAFGLPVSTHQQDAILHFAEVVPTALIVADAAIRMMRAHNVEGVLKAKAVHAMAQEAAAPTGDGPTDSAGI